MSIVQYNRPSKQGKYLPMLLSNSNRSDVRCASGFNSQARKLQQYHETRLPMYQLLHVIAYPENIPKNLRFESQTISDSEKLLIYTLHRAHRVRSRSPSAQPRQRQLDF